MGAQVHLPHGEVKARRISLAQSATQHTLERSNVNAHFPKRCTNPPSQALCKKVQPRNDSDNAEKICEKAEPASTKNQPFCGAIDLNPYVSYRVVNRPFATVATVKPSGVPIRVPCHQFPHTAPLVM